MPWTKVPGNWKTHKIADAVTVLNGYDLIILSDIVCRAPETRPKVEGENPFYLDVMKNVKVPWTTMIHDGSYAGKESDLMIKMLRTPSFSGKLITTRHPEASKRINKLFESEVLDWSITRDKITWIIDPYLPYDFRKANGIVPPLNQRKAEFLHLGRFSTNKGQDVMLDLLKDLNADVHLWGYCAYGKPSHGWLLWELATEHMKYAQVQFPKTTKPQMKHPQIHKFYTADWAVKAEHEYDGSKYHDTTWHYHGGYRDFDQVDWTPMIAVAMTNEGWKGTLEYATLDAIAHGCVAVVPKQQIEYADYKHLYTIPYVRCSYKIKKDQPLGGTREWDRATILDTLNGLAKTPIESLAWVANLQLEEIKSKHSCERILNLIVEAHK